MNGLWKNGVGKVEGGERILGNTVGLGAGYDELVRWVFWGERQEVVSSCNEMEWPKSCVYGQERHVGQDGDSGEPVLESIPCEKSSCWLLELQHHHHRTCSRRQRKVPRPCLAGKSSIG